MGSCGRNYYGACPNTQGYSNGDGNCHIHSDPNTHGYSHSNSDANGDSNGHRYGYSFVHTNSYSSAQADANTKAAPNSRTETIRGRGLRFFEIALVFVRLDHVAKLYLGRFGSIRLFPMHKSGVSLIAMGLDAHLKLSKILPSLFWGEQPPLTPVGCEGR